jgi:signal transduction histidine kinase
VTAITRHPAALAALLTVAGELEILLGPGGDGSTPASALALPAATAPLAWRRRHALAPLVAVAVTLLVQGLFDGFLAGDAVVPLLALLVALYTAGRHVRDAAGLTVAALAVVAATAARVAFDPAVADAGDAILTLVAVALPVLVGRWVRGQAELQAALAARSRRLLRDRDRAARQAAEEERIRIAGDLQAAVADGLERIVADASALAARLRDGDAGGARALLDGVAATARDALADVRRVLGILRRDGDAAPLQPHDPHPGARVPDTDPALDTDARVALPRSWPQPAWATDALVAGAVMVGGALELGLGAGGPGAALTAVLIAAPLAVKRRAPVPAALAVLGAIALQSIAFDVGDFPLSDMAAMVCATYAIGAHAERSSSVAGLVLLAAGGAAHAAVFYPDGVVPALLGGVAAPWTAGRVVRGRRLLTRQGREDAGSAELARRRDERAAVSAERMRVARELHDAVAHNVSVIAIQAGGAAGVVERDPQRAAGIAELVAEVAREALAELHRLAGAIHAAQDGAQPSLARVDALAERARESGLPVDVDVEGETTALPAGVDLAAYRIVQEALANAAKHAGGARAHVTVRYERGAVEVEVADEGRGPTPAPRRGGGGHGLVGIRERVGLYGGTLDLGPGPDGDGFRVRARLPVGPS